MRYPIAAAAGDGLSCVAGESCSSSGEDGDEDGSDGGSDKGLNGKRDGEWPEGMQRAIWAHFFSEKSSQPTPAWQQSSSGSGVTVQYWIATVTDLRMKFNKMQDEKKHLEQQLTETRLQLAEALKKLSENSTLPPSGNQEYMREETSTLRAVVMDLDEQVKAREKENANLKAANETLMEADVQGATDKTKDLVGQLTNAVNKLSNGERPNFKLIKKMETYMAQMDGVQNLLLQVQQKLTIQEFGGSVTPSVLEATQVEWGVISERVLAFLEQKLQTLGSDDDADDALCLLTQVEGYLGGGGQEEEEVMFLEDDMIPLATWKCLDLMSSIVEKLASKKDLLIQVMNYHTTQAQPVVATAGSDDKNGHDVEKPTWRTVIMRVGSLALDGPEVKDRLHSACESYPKRLPHTQVLEIFQQMFQDIASWIRQPDHVQRIIAKMKRNGHQHRSNGDDEATRREAEKKRARELDKMYARCVAGALGAHGTLQTWGPLDGVLLNTTETKQMQDDLFNEMASVLDASTARRRTGGSVNIRVLAQQAGKVRRDFNEGWYDSQEVGVLPAVANAETRIVNHLLHANMLPSAINNVIPSTCSGDKVMNYVRLLRRHDLTRNVFANATGTNMISIAMTKPSVKPTRAQILQANQEVSLSLSHAHTY